MKLSNIKLQEISKFDDLKSWHGPYLYSKLLDIDINCNICLIDRCHGSVDWPQLDIDEIVTSINNSTVDVIIYLIADHCYHQPLSNVEPNETKILKSITKPVIYIVWDYIIDQIHSTWYQYQIKYPIWATLCIIFNKQIDDEYKQYSSVNIKSTHKKYLYSTLSNIVIGFRLLNLVKFQKSNYYNKSLITFNAPTDSAKASIYWSWNIEQYGPIYAEQFKKILSTLPINTATSSNDIVLVNGADIDNDIVFDYTNAAYADSYVNVIVESTFESKFFSEKTFKPILANQFFVIISGKGSIAALKEMGIDTYDDIIDHSRYDNSPDESRIQHLHTLLNDMQHYDWEQIYTNTIERREKNRQFLLNLPFEKKFLSELEQMITTIVKPT
jgi:hypothetical protein